MLAILEVCQGYETASTRVGSTETVSGPVQDATCYLAITRHNFRTGPVMMEYFL